ncbi:MAG: hypothetical protein HDT44_00705 [Ruminococcaceae bacterium]|nr:hypothetical protein [Oscillospiraceae bacterium]
MIEVLLVTNSAQNIRIAWRHFCTDDYNAVSAVNNDEAIKTLVTRKSKVIPVFYCGSDTDCFIDFYRKLRAEKKTADTPLVVLADAKWTKALSEYVHLKNTCVMGVTVSSAKLLDVMKIAATGGFEKAAPRPAGQSDRR